MRTFLTVLIFFFGPTLLMLALRGLWLWLRWRLRRRREARALVVDAEVVGARPGLRAPWPYLLLSVLVGAVAAFFAWRSLHEARPAERVYVPAHLNEAGEVVPGHWIEKPKKEAR